MQHTQKHIIVKRYHELSTLELKPTKKSNALDIDLQKRQKLNTDQMC